MSILNKITIVGAGYVGMSIASALSANEEILILENNKEKIERINSGNPSIDDSGINAFTCENSPSIKATENKRDAYHEADFIIICVPTDFDKSTSSFNTDKKQKLAHHKPCCAPPALCWGSGGDLVSNIHLLIW